MDANTTITFRDVAHTPELEATVNNWVDWLETHCPRLIGCHVMVERPHRRRRRHRAVRVRIDATVPGAEIFVADDAHESLDSALRATFHTARRRLDERQDRQVRRRATA